MARDEDPTHLGTSRYASWYAGPLLADAAPRDRLQLTDGTVVINFSLQEAQELYRFMSSYYGWILGKLDPDG